MAAQTLVRSTVAGPTAPLQMTETLGGTPTTFWTPRLKAATLSGVIYVRMRGYQNSATADSAIGCEIAVVDGDGSNPVIYATGVQSVSNDLLTSIEGTVEAYIAGEDVSISGGQRLRIRFFIDDATQDTAVGLYMSTGWHVKLFYNGASGDSGDTYLHLPITLEELLPSLLPNVPATQALPLLVM